MSRYWRGVVILVIAYGCLELAIYLDPDYPLRAFLGIALGFAIAGGGLMALNPNNRK